MAKLTIIGTGLIGTSLGLALQRSQVRDLTIVGTDESGPARNGAQKRKAFDRVESRLMSAIDGADIVVLATPVMAMQELMEVIGPQLPEGCMVTDVGSSKKVVLEWAEQYLPGTVDFVGGHPMAGRETSGPEGADASLFDGKTYCVVPGPNASQRAVRELTNLIEVIGAKPYFISVGEHDSFVAAASHLPFLLSTALVGCTSKSANWDDIAQLASSGYNDISRLASGDAIMHRDICLTNREPIVAWLDSFIRELYEYRNILAAEEGAVDQDAVQRVFDDANLARAKWLAGDVNQRGRDFNPNRELPTFAESMGEMFVGRKAMEARNLVQRMWSGDDKRNRDRDRQS
jgi:prephenate dehydrogenase